MILNEHKQHRTRTENIKKLKKKNIKMTQLIKKRYIWKLL